MMKKAEKLLQPSVLQMRMKPAWDDAMPLFEKAAQYYQVLFPPFSCFMPPAWVQNEWKHNPNSPQL